ncbi:uncharacterized protein RBU47_006597 [Passerculus sandwichensis]
MKRPDTHRESSSVFRRLPQFHMQALLRTCHPSSSSELHPFTESQNILSWNQIIESNSWPCTGCPKNPTVCLRTLSKGWRKLPAAGGLLSGRATEGERPGPAARPLPPPGQRSRTGRAESAGVRSGPASCAVTCGGAERSRRRRAPRRGLRASTSRGSPRCPALRSRRRGTHNDPTTGRSRRRGATCQGTSQAGPRTLPTRWFVPGRRRVGSLSMPYQVPYLSGSQRL